MESSSSLSVVDPKQRPTRRHGGSSVVNDIWAAVRDGSVHDVEVALAHLKKSNGNIDARNAFGSNALHIAAWRNYVPIVRRLLAAGADPDARDSESGWSSLHRALNFGHLAVAGVLIEAGGSLVLEDSKGRTPVDLVSGPLSLASSINSGAKEVFSWGNGSNYQLGTGSTGIVRVPARIDALQGLDVIAVAAAKFHSVALTASGEVYSWGFGRGGRLGHPDFDIHSGQVAVISPRQITNSFGLRAVRVIAVAKHHSVVATNGGEVYTWGSNREGRLGYPSVDTQPTPRRVSTLKARVVAVAAANKHSAVLTDAGEVYTWGCNTEGQLGYGTSNSVSNYIPRLVECLKGKRFISVSTAKYHTVVLGAEGEVLTWGYRMVNPRRVPIGRHTKKAGCVPLKFHIAERLHVTSISAGMAHSSALSKDGLIFYWFSADPLLGCHQLLSMVGRQAVAVSSSKFRTAVATSTGDIYTWDGENSKVDTTPVPSRIHGVKHATQLSVGENHSVVVASVFIPDYPVNHAPVVTSSQPSSQEEDEVDTGLEFEDDGFGIAVSSPNEKNMGMERNAKSVPSLKDLCQRVVAQSVVEPKNALQVLEFADSLDADILREHCDTLILQNLDYILTVAPVLFGHVRPSLLARVEKALNACSTQPWSHRQLPTPSATLPAILDSEEDEEGLVVKVSLRGVTKESGIFGTATDGRICEGFLQHTAEHGDAVLKQVRAIQKKLQQIEALELRQAKGHILDDQQHAKIQTRRELEQMLKSLESGIIPDSVKIVGKQVMKSSVDSKEMPMSMGEVSKSRIGRSRQSRRLEKKRSKGQGSNDSQGVRSVEPDECGTDSLLTKSSESFVTISGFTSPPSKGSEPCAPEKSGKTEEGGSSLGTRGPAEESPITRKSILPAPVLRAEESPLPRKMKTLGKKVVKGGLSVFLSGALEEAPKAVVVPPPPITPKVDGPAWVGAHVLKEPTSLRAIQSQQETEPKLDFTKALKVGSKSSLTGETSVAAPKQVNVTKVVLSSKQVDKVSIVGGDTESTSKRVPLSQFVRTSPISMTSNKKTANAPPENSPPPWAASTSSSWIPTSLRDIQLQQVKSKVTHLPSLSQGSPNLSSPVGASGLSAAGSSLEHSRNLVDTPNRWFKPEVESPSTLRCIQIEEKAMKELRQLYRNVKLVRNDGN